MPDARARRQRRVADRLAARGGRAWPRTSACASSSWWSGWGTRRQHVPLARSLRRLPYGAAGSARARTSAHGLAPAGSPRPRRTASSRTLESAGDKDACATCQCPKGRCTLRVLAVPCLPSSTSAEGGERHAPVQQRKGAAAHPSILPSHGRHAWNARGSLITDIHVRPTAPQQPAHVPMRCAGSLARGNPSRIGENSHE